MQSEPNTAWRSHAFRVAWPTVLLFAAILAGEALLWWATLSGRLSLWFGWLPATLLGYLAFTVMHEAGHGNIHGRDPRWKPLAEACGWLSGLLILGPYPAFRVIHNLHHSHTNDPQRDPDHWVAAGGTARVALRCLTMLPYYYWAFLWGPSSRTRPARLERPFVLWTTAAYVVLAAALTVSGLGRQVFALWLVPAVLACGLLAFVFDWLPHHPHHEQRRGHDTQIGRAHV